MQANRPQVFTTRAVNRARSAVLMGSFQIYVIVDDLAKEMCFAKNDNTLNKTICRFYHIDVAFCPLSDELALWFPGAFDPVTQHNMKNEGVELVPVNTLYPDHYLITSILDNRE